MSGGRSFAGLPLTAHRSPLTVCWGRIGPGGPAGLQNRDGDAFGCSGGFDSHTLPPLRSRRRARWALGAASRAQIPARPAPARPSRPLAAAAQPSASSVRSPPFSTPSLVPGWAQSKLDRKLTAALFVAWEGVTLGMALKAGRRGQLLCARTAPIRARVERQEAGAAGLAHPARVQSSLRGARGLRGQPPPGFPGRRQAPRRAARHRRPGRRAVPAPVNRAPIGIFDSGLGGLTVAHAIFERLPRDSTIYFGDTARVPYGPKSPETVRRYSREILDWLLGQGVKAIVIACNTSTAHALEALQDRSPVPVIGVIEPGARAAVAAAGGPAHRRHRHRRAPSRAAPTSGPSAARARAPRSWQPACPLFVPLVEEGWFDHPATRARRRGVPGAAPRARGGYAGARLHPLSAAQAAAPGDHGAGGHADRQRRGDRARRSRRLLASGGSRPRTAVRGRR